MDALKITEKAHALVEQHGDAVEGFANDQLKAAEAAGLHDAVREWEALLEAIAHLRGKSPA